MPRSWPIVFEVPFYEATCLTYKGCRSSVKIRLETLVHRLCIGAATENLHGSQSVILSTPMVIPKHTSPYMNGPELYVSSKTHHFVLAGGDYPTRNLIEIWASTQCFICIFTELMLASDRAKKELTNLVFPHHLGLASQHRLHFDVILPIQPSTKSPPLSGSCDGAS